MTENLIDCLRSYFDTPTTEEEEEPEDKIEEYASQLPDYIRILTIGAMSFQLWLKS
jgi:hypothetical protein